ILGNIACAQANLLSLGLMIKELPPNSIWAAGGIGDWQLKMNALAIVDGGGVRIGLEDNIYYDADRTRLASNAELILRIKSIAASMGREPYSHKAVRTLLGLDRTNG
ncbi:MAG TPA: 3-keto-5-aminohexanoate cleavage protein, partial [bacterium]|nr:3-keto-5-aminohexanoate cleavage protein [bacterium]